VRDGKMDLPLLPILYEFPRICWKRRMEATALLGVVNPNLGKSLDEAFLAANAERSARADGGEQLTLVASQHFNVEIGMRLRSDRWYGADFWEAAGFEPIRDLAELLRRVEVAVVGADGGGLDDLSGVCVLGRDKKTKVWLYWNHAFAHRKVLQLRKEIAPALRDFEADGDLTFWGNADVAANVAKRLLEDGSEEEFLERAHDGSDIDADVIGIVRVCRQVRDAGLLPASHGIGVDPAAIGSLLDALVADGFTVSDGALGDIVGLSQSAAAMNSAIITMQRKLEAGTAAHGGTRLMAWCVSNAKAEQKGNAVAITKQAAGKAKIDPLAAAFNATKLMERNPEAAPSVDDWLEALRA
jgi:phage terminase large subunit-like protein